jgi:hypothetical protein
MATREIPHQQWLQFLNSISVDYLSRNVTVQVSDPELGYQIEMRNLPLVGVSADLKAGGGPRVEVIVGRTDFEHTTHTVVDPTAVRVIEGEQGEVEVVEIESRSGSKTLLVLTPGAFDAAGSPQERK